MIILSNAEKALKLYPITICNFFKALSKLRLEGILLNLIKGLYKTLTANITHNGERLNAFPKTGNKARMLVLTMDSTLYCKS